MGFLGIERVEFRLIEEDGPELMPPELVGERGPKRLGFNGDAGPILFLTEDLSLSFLFFLQMTRSPGCGGYWEDSGAFSVQLPDTSFESFGCLEDVDLFLQSSSIGVAI